MRPWTDDTYMGFIIGILAGVYITLGGFVAALIVRGTMGGVN
jgi:hypothetical protein